MLRADIDSLVNWTSPIEVWYSTDHGKLEHGRVGILRISRMRSYGKALSS